MKALVYGGPGSRVWKDVPDPLVTDPEDAIVRVDAVTICGTDLHILLGDVPDVQVGRILGHEAVGTVTEIGDAVRDVAVGDRVLVSCISPCGRCDYCRERRYGRCTGGGGWVLGHLIDGTQAEQVRVPFADRGLHPLPPAAPPPSSSAPTRRSPHPSRRRPGCRRRPADAARMWPSKPSASPRPSSSAPSWSAPVGTSPTSACTAGQRPCTSRRSGP